MPNKHKKGKSPSLVKRVFSKWVDVNWYTVSTSAGLSQGNSASITTSFSTYSICALAQGLDRVNRIGRVVRFKRFILRAHVEAGAESLLLPGDLNNCVRFALVKPRQPTSSLTGLTTVYLPVGDPITAIWDDDYIERVLFDKVVNVATQIGVGPTSTDYATDFVIDIPLNVTTVYSGTPAAAAIESGQLILIAVSDSTTIPNPLASASFRVYYEDVVG
jgi:hypothetical protein